MKLEDKCNDETKVAFFDAFFGKLCQYPFGGMPKRDLDCLIFSLLKKHKLIPGTMNRDKAYSLGISESKYKSLLVDSDAKFREERDQNASVQEMFKKLVESETGIHLEGDTLVFLEEDPVVRAEFAHAMKRDGFYTDTSFNSEIIKVKAADFLAFAHAEKILEDKEILEILNKDKAGKERVKELEDGNKSMKDIMQDVFDIVKMHGGSSITMFSGLFDYTKGVLKAKWNSRQAS